MRVGTVGQAWTIAPIKDQNWYAVQGSDTTMLPKVTPAGFKIKIRC